jgi:hypothetical protein
VVIVLGYKSRGLARFPALPDFVRSVSGTASTQPRESKKPRIQSYEIHRADYVIPLYPQKLAPTSPTGGGRLVGIIRSRTQATEFVAFSIRVTSTVQIRTNSINITAVTNIHTPIEKLLDESFSMWSLSYQGELATCYYQNFLLNVKRRIAGLSFTHF